MDLEDLRTFLDVMRTRSFAEVARERNVAPATISRAIATLESQLGARLFQRTTRKVMPTEAGMRYYERLDRIMADLVAANAAVGDFGLKPQGTLRVTASNSFGVRMLAPLLPEFSSMYSDLAVELILDDAVLDIVAAGIDVAVRLGKLPDSSLVAVELMRTSYVVCASPVYLARAGTPSTPEDLAHHNCMLFPLPGFRTRWIFRGADGKASEVAVRGNTVISNALALHDCATAGMGVTMLPDWLVAPDIKAGRLVQLLPAYQVAATDFDTAAWIVYPSRRYVPSKVTAFVDFVRQRIGGRAKPMRAVDRVAA